MSGGIKYRLTSRERNLFTDQLGVLESLRARLKSGAIDAKLGDPELEVSVEENSQGPRFAIDYPFDTDNLAKNGRLYVRDVFQVSKDGQSILSLDRSVRQDIQATKSMRYWVEVARKDHAQEKISLPSDHLNRFLDDLRKLPTPEKDGAVTRLFLAKVLNQLHRPFPDNNEKVVRKNFVVFKEASDKIGPFGMRMKFGDPQSGLSLLRDGNKLFLNVQVVLDNDPKPGLESEKNGRMYLLDSYELDPVTKQVIGTKREILPSETSDANFEKAFALIKDSPPPSPDLPELQDLVTGWLFGMGEAPSPAISSPVNDFQAPIPTEPKDPSRKQLYSLFLATQPRPDPTKAFLLALAKQDLGASAPIMPALQENDRASIHELLAWVLAENPTATDRALAQWTQEKSLLPETKGILRALGEFSKGNFDQAGTEIQPWSEHSAIARQLSQVLAFRNRQETHKASLEILKTAVLERIEQARSEDQAWLKALGRGISGSPETNHEQRRFAALSFFKGLEENPNPAADSLGEEIKARRVSGSEGEIQKFLLKDPSLVQLVSVLEEEDPLLRQKELLKLARGEFLGAAKLPATAKAIADRCDPSLPETEALRNWFSGHASFGQKFDVLLPAFSEEVLAPRTLLSMMAAGTFAQLGKAAFLGRVGYQTQRLRLAAEVVSVAVEAPSFVLTDKILASAWTSPDRQWEHLPSDFFSAFLAFGALRGAGLASRRLTRALESSKSLERFSLGRTRIALAEQWIPKVEDLAKAEGRWAAAQRLAGKVAVPTLKYLGNTGISRAWIPSVLRGLSTHGLSLFALTSSNSLTRLLGLREASQQGWRSDLVDDALMYGHFLVAGHIAQSLGRSSIDQRLDIVETLPYEVKAKAPTPLEKSAPVPEAPDSNGEARSSAPPSSEPIPVLDVPHELKNFGRNFSKTILGMFPFLGRFAGETIAKLRSWRQGPATPKAVDSAPPKSTTPPSSKQAPVDAGKMSGSNLPPPELSTDANPARPTVPASPPATLRPTDERMLFRWIEEPLPPGKGKEMKLDVEILGQQEELRFRDGEKTAERHYESILGREDLQSPAQAAGIDFGFPSQALEISPQHAKLKATIQWSLKKNDKGGYGATPKDWRFQIEDLQSPTGTFVNGERISKATRLQDGDRIRLGANGQDMVLRLDGVQPDAFLLRPEIDLIPERDRWIVGREQAGAPTPEIAFPMSFRDISRRHARILRDGEGRYLLQDMSSIGTRVNGRRLHGTHVLLDGDRLQFGNSGEMVFTLPKGTATAEPLSDADRPRHAKQDIEVPEQASVHPAYRHVPPEVLEEYFLSLAEDSAPSADNFRAGQLRLADDRDILLSSLFTGWAIGAEGPLPGNSKSLQFSAPPEIAKHPVLLYLDRTDGKFILRPLSPDAEISLQTRPERYLAEDGKAPKPSGPRQRLQSWTRLEGGERIFLGDNFFFDFWPRAVFPPRIEPENTSGAIPAAAPLEEKPREAAPKALLFQDGEMHLALDKAIVLHNTSEVSQLELRDGPDQVATEILIPTSSEVQTTKLYEVNGQWKIRSEGGSGEPVVVNGMRLPPKIELDLLPDTLIEVAGLKLKIRRPE